MCFKEHVEAEKRLLGEIRALTYQCELADSKLETALSEWNVLSSQLKNVVGKEEALQSLQDDVEVLIDDLNDIRSSRFWLFLLRFFGYNKEKRAARKFARIHQSLIRDLSSSSPLPKGVDDLQALHGLIGKARESLETLSIKGKEIDRSRVAADTLRMHLSERRDLTARLTADIDDSVILREDIFDVSPEKIKNFKDRLLSADPDATMLTSSQWNFILSRHRNTYVVAGAGAGKTRSLIYRALFLHKCLKVKLTELTLLTFTRKTRYELIGKFQQVLEKYDKNDKLSVDEIKKTVHTFHSKASEMGRIKTSIPDVLFFEILKDSDKRKDMQLKVNELLERFKCRSALNIDPLSASNFDPPQAVSFSLSFLS